MFREAETLPSSAAFFPSGIKAFAFLKLAYTAANPTFCGYCPVVRSWSECAGRRVNCALCLACLVNAAPSLSDINVGRADIKGDDPTLGHGASSQEPWKPPGDRARQLLSHT